MPANISLVTLGVEDLAASTVFYERLGWRRATASQDSVSFLQGHAIVLALLARGELARDAGVPDVPGGFCAVTLAMNLSSPAAVDDLYAQALASGADARKPPAETTWGGYSGYFSDPDGHLWEVAHNPFFPMDEGGRLSLDIGGGTT